MFVDVDGARVHALTGGPVFDASLPTVVFLHGAGMDATVWALQTRWFAHHGFAVLALDFPGHGRSESAALPTIEAMADWVARVLTAVGASPATIVGHSMGSLVALALAARQSERVNRLALVGTAQRMKVGPDLLAAAKADSPDAFAMVNLWGHGARAGLGQAETPGLWMAGGGQRLLERSQPGVLAVDLVACNDFVSDDTAVGNVRQPVLILQGARDMMTPLKGAKALASALPDPTLIPYAEAGHMLMVEEGARVLADLSAFVPRSLRNSAATPLAEARP